MASTQIWMKFFLEAGIPEKSAVQYAISFEQNRMDMNMLMDLDKEYLRDLKITALGDIISILKHAKVQHLNQHPGQLISAIKDKDEKKVSYLVENMDSSEINKLGGWTAWTALHEAVKKYRKNEAVNILLEHLRGVQGRGRWTPLHVACFNNNHQTVRKLLARSGIQVNARNGYGYTPIMYAALRCKEEALKLMLGDPLVDLDTRGDDGKSLQELVGSRGSEEGKKQKCLKMIKEEKIKRENRQAGQQRTSQDGQIGGCAGKTDNVEVSEKKGEDPAGETENPGSSASPNVDNDLSLCWSCWNSRRDEEMYKCGACNGVTAYCSRECSQKDLPVFCW